MKLKLRSAKSPHYTSGILNAVYGNTFRSERHLRIILFRNYATPATSRLGTIAAKKRNSRRHRLARWRVEGFLSHERIISINRVYA